MVFKSRNPDKLINAAETELPTNQASEDFHFRSEIMRLSREMIEDGMTAEKLTNNPLWPFISKSLKLTFIDEKEAFMFRQLLEAEICKVMRNTAPCAQDGKFHEELAQARIIALCNINRAKGTLNASTLINERIANISQFSQHMTNSVDRGGGGNRSFLGRIFGVGR